MRFAFGIMSFLSNFGVQMSKSYFCNQFITWIHLRKFKIAFQATSKG